MVLKDLAVSIGGNSFINFIVISMCTHVHVFKHNALDIGITHRVNCTTVLCLHIMKLNYRNNIFDMSTSNHTSYRVSYHTFFCIFQY